MRPVAMMAVIVPVKKHMMAAGQCDAGAEQRGNQSSHTWSCFDRHKSSHFHRSDCVNRVRVGRVEVDNDIFLVLFPTFI